MKKIFKKYSILFSILLFLFSCSDNEFDNKESLIGQNTVQTRAVSTTDYYWYRGEKIGLNKNERKKFILFSQEDGVKLSANFTNLKFAESPSIVKLSPKIKFSNSKAAFLFSSSLMWASVETSESLTKFSEVLYEAPYFTTEDGHELGLSHLFYVKLKSEKDVEMLTEMATKLNVEIIGNNEYMPLWYTLGCTKTSKGNALDVANIFYESNLFADSQPDLMSDDSLQCVNDPRFASQQWNLYNIGQDNGTYGIDVRLCGTRSITIGSQNIIVAVIDQGIQLNHPDLNIHSISYDSETGTSPSVVYGTHGTNCAGFISARTNNNLGVAAIAPSCPSMSISNTLAATPDSRQKRADAINFACNNGASVISNSWGSAVQYTMINDAIVNALTNGRGGRGCVIVFATGNDYSTIVSYPANIHPDILAVGSINRNGLRSNFSNYGSALDIVAPGEDVVTTTTGSGYSQPISGTSFACPHVAATAALILSENSLLTQKQVADIIETTAQKVGNYNYSTTSGRPNGTWHQEMGYGLLNTFAAVAKVKSETLSFSNQSINSNLFAGKWNVIADNVNVSNNAHLTLNFGEQITINPPFTVNAGSQLSIYR